MGAAGARPVPIDRRAPRMTRPLWFGVAMFSAFGSMYAGLFGMRLVQYPLIAVAVVAVVMAMRAPAPPPAEDPRRKGPPV